jgi:uncharacterized protein (TIGR00251 family)
VGVSGVNDLYSTDGDGVVLRVHVQPRAGRSAVVGRHRVALKVRVAAPPVDDRANEATIELVAEMLDVPKQQVSIVAGERSRVKRLRVTPIEADDVESRLRVVLDDAAAPDGPRRRRAPD